MKIWLPGLLYHVFPLLCVIIGFLIVMLIHTPAAIIIAAIMYAYSFSVLWFRYSDETEDRT
jgi:positive regulator of sigma E activity